MNTTTHDTTRTPACLIVLDGWGISEDTQHNAIHDANTPNFDTLWNSYPHAQFDASGVSVGLPEGQMGNSEIGHMAIGAGTPIDTDLVRIHKAIQSGEFSQNADIRSMLEHVRTHNSTLHLMGLFSPGGIHSHSDHLYALIKEAVRSQVSDIVLHLFLDGRDTPPQSAVTYLDELEHFLTTAGAGCVGSISGRYYAMDRDNNWDRVQQVLDVLFEGRTERVHHDTSPSKAVRTEYEKGNVDEHIEPMLFSAPTGEARVISTNDSVCFFNFRADRARMLAQKIQERSAEMNLYFVTMTQYAEDITCHVAFPPFRPTATLASEIARAGLTQVHIAETEKYAHATYFLNGGREKPHDNETHILIESRKDVRTHDEAPEMRAKEIADSAIAQIEAGADFIFINFANADMVGHTANVPALHKALEAVDSALGRVVEAVHAHNGFAFITADHGNAERNFDPVDAVKHTAHTTNMVPAILTVPEYILEDGSLPDIAPTLLTVMGLGEKIPPSMTGVVRAHTMLHTNA
jgi:2,3-bisphosphoglycerate-independent phosphoglycerate mutase